MIWPWTWWQSEPLRVESEDRASTDDFTNEEIVGMAQQMAEDAAEDQMWREIGHELEVWVLEQRLARLEAEAQRLSELGRRALAQRNEARLELRLMHEKISRLNYPEMRRWYSTP